MNAQRFNQGLGTPMPAANNAGSFAFPTASNPAPTAAPANPAPAPRTVAAAAAATPTVGPVALPTNTAARAAAIVVNTNTAAASTAASGYTSLTSTQQPAQRTPAAPYEVRQYASAEQEKAAAGSPNIGAWLTFAVLAAGALWFLSRRE